MGMSNLQWGEMVGAFLGGGGLAKVGDLLFGKKSREVKALGDAIDSLSTQLKYADARMDSFNTRLDECHDLHEACEQGRAVDRREIEELKRKVAKAVGDVMEQPDTQPLGPHTTLGRPVDPAKVLKRAAPPKRRPKAR